MDSLFENKYIRSKELVKEVTRSLILKSPAFIVLYVIMSLCLIINIWSSAITGEYDITIPVYVIVFAICLAVIYMSNSSRIIKADNELNGGQPMEISSVVTEDGIKCTCSNGSVNDIAFASIKKVRSTKNIVFIVTKAKLSYIFPKDSFTKGTADEFEAFLKSKVTK